MVKPRRVQRTSDKTVSYVRSPRPYHRLVAAEAGSVTQPQRAFLYRSRRDSGGSFCLACPSRVKPKGIPPPACLNLVAVFTHPAC